MPRLQKPPETNEEILRNLRYGAEMRHRFNREHFFVDKSFLLPLNPSSNDLQVNLEHIQDSCNKSTAIYSINPSLEPHTTAYGQEYTKRCDIIYYIYERWFCCHNVNIDFGNFIAKLISVRTPFEKQPTVGGIINFHQIWCEHVERTLPSCATEKHLQEVAVQDRPYNHSHGPIGINQDQNMHFKLRSLFRSLILIIDKIATQKGAERVVHLIRTGLSELSAPITFESITPKFEHDPSRGHVTTALSAAITFVMALESRERAAFPEEYRDPSVWEEKDGPGSHMKLAESRGYDGPHISGSSGGWIQLAEDGDVIPPVTPRVMARRCDSGLGPPRTASAAFRRRVLARTC